MPDSASHQNDVRSTIVEVASRLLREHGSSAVTTRRVAEEAGVQAPTIYRLFGDKDGLLEAVAEYVMATFVSAKALSVEAAAADDIDALDDLRAGWDAQIDFGVTNPTLFLFMNDPERAASSPATRAGYDVLRARVHRVATSGRLRVSENRAVDLIRAGGVGTITTILATPPGDRDPALAASMFEAVLRQILTDEPAATSNDSTATAVAFRAMVPDLTILTDAERQLLTDWLDRVIDH
ncbi:TetR/AcrR family transcriptional regulator [Aeromicrobium chenweiae]|uniref:TetR family transcriptional regulator n=1 Tax=Aeromicrobium chenweiae TaxID=2079793 RepID=A0A2S0WKN3_9ACTN|nr:TetR/AcrR family transcriptional regulator [Aeromicrobium chenweiae]AWB91909.1 TetR family transcriptional regulator [Aeromicrobium chenweiae]TGN32758.1 TetR/AcrR family transcriptional regulator [Aeromicrobium chenweiae]